ncbi:MAG: serine/threonine protein kinase [Myxococcales bacterium]|nr:serine/threonine protein kinase [Myxococcales bacterium]
MGACSHCGGEHDVYANVCPATGRTLTGPTYTVVNEDEVLVGTVVADRYQVRDILGQGGTGTVFLVEHVDFPRLAAMKVIRSRRMLTDAALRVVQTDGYAAWSVTHPCMPDVIDVGSLADGAPFFVTERLEGETLATRAARTPLSLAAAVDMVMQVLSALDALHAADVVVADLRPQNVFLAHRRGCRALVKLLDVGLHRLTPIQTVAAEWEVLRAASGQSPSGLLAVPYYLAPEQISGAPPDRRADLFAAALLLYEALTGERAFTGDSLDAVFDAISLREPTPLTEHRPELPVSLDGWLSQALAKHPRDRHGTAREMQDDLRMACEGARVAAPAPQRTRSSSSMQAVAPLPPPVMAPPAAHIPAGASSAPLPPGLDSFAPARLRDSDASIETPFGARSPFLVPDARGALESSVDTLSPTTRRTGGAAIQQAIAAALADGTTPGGPPSLDVTEIAVDVEVDENSADSPVRTVRPPPENETVITAALRYDPDGTVPGHSDRIAARMREADGTLPGAPRPADSEEEETQTLPLSPELRAQVDEMFGKRR